MRVRAWITEALSGTVQGEVLLAGGSLASSFGGADCSADLAVGHLTTRDGTSMDWDALSLVRRWADGGRWALVVTAGQAVIGEWLLMSSQAKLNDTSISVRGVEWEGFPALRSLMRSYNMPGVDMLDACRALWTDAFQTNQAPAFDLAMPSGTVGVKVDLVEPSARTKFYSDVIDSIVDGDDGFEWKVRTTPVWSGGALTSVNRAIVMGRPVLADGSVFEMRNFGQGSRAGNVLDATGGTTFEHYAVTFTAWGAGEGRKQLVAEETMGDEVKFHVPAMTRIETFSGVRDVNRLHALARQRVLGAQSIENPWKVELGADLLDELPTVGRQARLLMAPSPVWPGGVDEPLRIGAVSMSLDGMDVTTVEVQAA